MFIMPIPNNFSKLESSELQALNSNFFWVLFFAAFGKRPGNASATAVAFGLDDITTWGDNTFWDRKGSLCEFLEPEHIRWKFRIQKIANQQIYIRIQAWTTPIVRAGNVGGPSMDPNLGHKAGSSLGLGPDRAWSL